MATDDFASSNRYVLNRWLKWVQAMNRKEEDKDRVSRKSENTKEDDEQKK